MPPTDNIKKEDYKKHTLERLGGSGVGKLIGICGVYSRYTRV